MKSHVVIFQHNGETKKKKEFSRTTANFFYLVCHLHLPIAQLNAFGSQCY